MPQNISLDPKQTKLLESFQKVAASLQESSLRATQFQATSLRGAKRRGNLMRQESGRSCLMRLPRLLRRLAMTCIPHVNTTLSTKHIQGIYLYGSVGCGKTMLMKMFYEMLDVEKEIIHFQSFMHELHRKIHELQTHNSRDRVIENLAKDIVSKVRVLCIDEFEIKDITDAMIVMRLFSYLSKGGVFIFLTTNTRPDDLYKDGLQRGSFLPFIKNIKDSYTVLDLNNDKDYRFEKATGADKKIFFPITEETIASITKIKESLCLADELHPGNFQVFGREVVFAHTHGNILFTNFDELFMQDFGYADYVNLCKKFNIIVLENVRKIKEDETDIVIRFINFIDNAYFNKILLFATLETDPSLLYSSGKRLSEFKRTVSRLYEENW